jgi:hypothetical protein
MNSVAKHEPGLVAMHQSARCTHLKLNNQTCAAPAMKGKTFCLFHASIYDHMTVPRLPEDAATIQITLGRIIGKLEDGEIEGRNAGLILYALQIASGNLKRLGLELPATLPSNVPMPDDELVVALFQKLNVPVDRQLEGLCWVRRMVDWTRAPYNPRVHGTFDGKVPPDPSDSGEETAK